MFQTHGLSVEFGGRPALADVSLACEAGRFTAIAGPNGSGKTTLLRALAGELPYTGSIRLNGRDLRALPAWQAAALRAVLPQSTTLSFPFTAREIVAMGRVGDIADLSPHDARRLPEKALERVELADFGGRFYQALSGGEQQRVQLARVLCQVWRPVVDGTPRWLLLDEPVSSLDIRHQLLVMSIAREFSQTGGGVIVVLHDLNLAAMFADDLVLMRRGRVAVTGTPQQVFAGGHVADVFDVALQPGAVPPAAPFVLPQSWAAAKNPMPRTS